MDKCWERARYPIAPLVIFSTFFFVIVLFYVESECRWEGWSRVDGYPHVYCEQAAPDKPLEQFSNSFSNLLYMLAGLVIMFRPVQFVAPLTTTEEERARARHQNLFRSHWLYAVVMGFSLVAIGWGSLFYHGSLTNAGRFFDWLGMYMFGAFFCVYELARFVELPHLLFSMIYVAACAFLSVAILWLESFWRTPIFAILLMCGCILTATANYRWKSEARTCYILSALALLLVALVFWQLDRTLVLCWPTSLFQGHALWQLMTAVAAYLLYGYMCSEYSPRYHLNASDSQVSERLALDDDDDNNSPQDLFDFNDVDNLGVVTSDHLDTDIDYFNEAGNGTSTNDDIIVN